MGARRRVSRVLVPPRAARGLSRSGDGAFPLGRLSPGVSCDRPERAAREGPPGIEDCPRCLPLLLWSCSRWGFPCRRRCAGCAVRSYRTVSPLPPVRCTGRAQRCTFCRTVPGEIAPAGRIPSTVRYRGAPDFPLSARRRRAAVRPSGAFRLDRCGMAFIKGRFFWSNACDQGLVIDADGGGELLLRHCQQTVDLTRKRVAFPPLAIDLPSSTPCKGRWRWCSGQRSFANRLRDKSAPLRDPRSHRSCWQPR